MERHRLTYHGATVCIHEGDIAEVAAAALVTAINSLGMWSGGIDRVIVRYAGDDFHSQAADAMPLRDGQTVVAKRRAPHRAGWGDVVFVTDDLRLPLSEIVLAAFLAAGEAGYRSVAIPAIRTGAMLGEVEADANEAVAELMKGIRAYLDATPGTTITEIHIVVFHDQEVLDFLVSGNHFQA